MLGFILWVCTRGPLCRIYLPPRLHFACSTMDLASLMSWSGSTSSPRKAKTFLKPRSRYSLSRSWTFGRRWCEVARGFFRLGACTARGCLPCQWAPHPSTAASATRRLWRWAAPAGSGWSPGLWDPCGIGPVPQCHSRGVSWPDVRRLVLRFDARHIRPGQGQTSDLVRTGRGSGKWWMEAILASPWQFGENYQLRPCDSRLINYESSWTRFRN